MNIQCSICQHAAVDEINQALRQGVSLRAVAREYNFSPAAVGRHLKHLAGRQTDPREVRDPRESWNLLDELDFLRFRALRVTDLAEESFAPHAALQSVREARHLVTLREKYRRYLERRRVRPPAPRLPQ